MRISRLYLDLPLAPGESLILPSAAAHYLVHVLRLGPGDALTLFNGQGGEYAAQLSSVSKKAVVVRVGEYRPLDCESPLALTLVQGVARNEHMDYAIQKAVELGVQQIAPVITARTQRIDAARLQSRAQHWASIIENACAQCGRNRLPVLLPVQTFPAWLAQAPQGQRLLLEPSATLSLHSLTLDGPSLSVLIGPEGGFTDAELAAALAAGCLGVRLGPRVLRTETAALAMLAICQARWGDLG